MFFNQDGRGEVEGATLKYLDKLLLKPNNYDFYCGDQEALIFKGSHSTCHD